MYDNFKGIIGYKHWKALYHQGSDLDNVKVIKKGNKV